MDPLLKKLQAEIAVAVQGMGGEELSRHPPGKWCAAEVLEHLFLTYTGTLRGLDRVVEAGKPQATKASWRQRWRTVVVVGFGYLPTGREAPPVARPRGLPAQTVLAEIGPKITAMDDMLGRCEEKFGVRVKLLDHPILGPLTAREWRKFHLLHGLHHVKQIRRLRGSGS